MKEVKALRNYDRVLHEGEFARSFMKIVANFFQATVWHVDSALSTEALIASNRVFLKKFFTLVEGMGNTVPPEARKCLANDKAEFIANLKRDGTTWESIPDFPTPEASRQQIRSQASPQSPADETPLKKMGRKERNEHERASRAERRPVVEDDTLKAEDVQGDRAVAEAAPTPSPEGETRAERIQRRIREMAENN
jgi:hypothetical protein